MIEEGTSARLAPIDSIVSCEACLRSSGPQRRLSRLIEQRGWEGLGLGEERTAAGFVPDLLWGGCCFGHCVRWGACEAVVKTLRC